MEFQCVVGNKFINKQPLGPSDAVSNQRNKMLVMDTANYLNFSLEFTLPLPASMAYSLVDGASSHLFSFVFRCISMVENHH